jgi:hypothetical protein
MQANPVSGLESLDPFPNPGNLSGDLVAERDGSRSGRRAPGPVVRIRVADPCGTHPDKHLAFCGLWDGDVLQFQWLSSFDEADSSQLNCSYRVDA